MLLLLATDTASDGPTRTCPSLQRYYHHLAATSEGSKRLEKYIPPRAPTVSTILGVHRRTYYHLAAGLRFSGTVRTLEAYIGPYLRRCRAGPHYQTATPTAGQTAKL